MLLNEKELRKKEIIEEVLKGNITKTKAAEKLGVKRRTIYRLIESYKKEGEKGLVHKSRGSESTKKIPKYIEEDIVNIYLDEYFDFNFEHFYEKLTEKYVIYSCYSYSTICNILNRNDVISPIALKETKKKYFAKMKEKEDNQELNDEIKEVYESRLLKEEYAKARKTSMSIKFGERLEMDACKFIWFGDDEKHLHLVVDVGTKKVLFGWFNKEETTRTYFILLYNVVMNYGIPLHLRTDNRSSFTANNNPNKTIINTTQMGRICQTLNIELSTSSCPTFKAHVERENGTFKRRLVAELRYESITTYEDANKYLNDVFIPNINKKFSIIPLKKENIFKELNMTEESLNIVFSDRWNRIMDNASSFKHLNKYYQPIDEFGNVVHYKRGTKVIFLLDYNYRERCIIEGIIYDVIAFETKQITTKNENTNKYINEKEKKKFIPSSNHPWRKNMMLK